MPVWTDIESAVCPEPVAVAERRADTRQQFRGPEWFGDIVVGAQIQRLDFLVFGRPGGNDDDRSACPGADFTYDLVSAHIRKSEIQKDDIRTLGADQVESLCPIVRTEHAVVMALQHLPHKGLYVLFVFNDQD